MRWAFWRRRRPQPDAAHQPAASPALSPAPRPARDEPGDPDAPASAFSGAAPSQAAPAPLPPQDELDLHALRCAPPELAAAVRADVLDLVAAAAARDGSAARAVLRRLAARAPDAPRLAVVAALAPLGDRFAVLADSEQLDAVLAQGELVGHRAERRVLALAPQSPLGVVQHVVHRACGLEHAPPSAADAEAVLLVVAGLLAQTAEDGAGDLAALAREVSDLLAGS